MNKTIIRNVLFCAMTVGIATILIFSINTWKRVNEIGGAGEEMKLLYYSYMSQLYLSISDDSTPISCKSIKEYLIKSDLSSEPVLIVSYSNFSCTSCMDYLLKGLEKVFPNYALNKHILFVASGYKTEPQRHYGNSVFLPYGDSLELSSEESNEPFLFICLNDVVFHVFTPSSPYDELYKTYLTVIKDKYFLNEE